MELPLRVLRGGEPVAKPGGELLVRGVALSDLRAHLATQDHDGSPFLLDALRAKGRGYGEVTRSRDALPATAFTQ
ncbi:hypothetical protein GCM10010151_35040 [Actinoallomurus spadix]|uniref:Uncharacterized protein n=1 Tax=Actinoallomurus spadix TaxID=79912 RepID=A0ABP3GD02_9ACTN